MKAVYSLIHFIVEVDGKEIEVTRRKVPDWDYVQWYHYHVDERDFDQDSTTEWRYLPQELADLLEAKYQSGQIK